MGFSVTIVRKICTGTGRRGKLSLRLKMDMALSPVHCQLPGGAARGEGAALTLLWIPEPRRNGPATELRATDISFADKIFCRSQNRGLHESAAAPRRPRIVRMPGRISRDTTNLDPHSVHVVAPRRQGRVEFSGCIPVAALSLRHQSD